MKDVYDKIFFDLDGTLSDSYNGIENGILYALKQSDIPEISKEEIKKLIGIPLSESLKKYCSNNTEKAEKACRYFRDYYDKKGIYESRIYPGIKKLLHELSVISELYVITAKPTLIATKLLSYHELDLLFTGILGCPANNSVFCKSVLISQVPYHENSIIIGDKAQDVIAGRKARIKTGGVLYGYGTLQEITNAKPDFIIDSVVELKKILSC